METNKLSAAEISAILVNSLNVIERAALSLTESEPTVIFDQLEDMISSATVKVAESLRSYERRYATPEAIQAWVDRAARWHVTNLVTRYKRHESKVSARGSLHMVPNVVNDATVRSADSSALSKALATLSDETRTIFVRLTAGEKAVDVARSLGMSGPTVTRRKQEALATVKLALAGKAPTVKPSKVKARKPSKVKACTVGSKPSKPCVCKPCVARRKRIAKITRR